MYSELSVCSLPPSRILSKCPKVGLSVAVKETTGEARDACSRKMRSGQPCGLWVHEGDGLEGNQELPTPTCGAGLSPVSLRKVLLCLSEQL